MHAIFDIAAIVIVLAAAFCHLNHKLLKLPHTIGLVVITLAASLVVLGFDAVIPSLELGDQARGVMASIDFFETLIQGLLSFLLIVGALHVDLAALASRKWVIRLMA